MLAYSGDFQQGRIRAMRAEVGWVKDRVKKFGGVEKDLAEDFCREFVDGPVVVRSSAVPRKQVFRLPLNPSDKASGTHPFDEALVRRPNGLLHGSSHAALTNSGSYQSLRG